MKTILVAAFLFCAAWLRADDLSSQFIKPPASARPWVYWFWNNGNVTKAGITADLEAMQRVGIGGVIIMDVVERFAPPPGTADFMNKEWQELFKFAVSEAHRLGIEINMTPTLASSPFGWEIGGKSARAPVIWLSANLAPLYPVLCQSSLPDD